MNLRRAVSAALIDRGYAQRERMHVLTIDAERSWVVDTGPLDSRRTDIAPFVGIRHEALERLTTEMLNLAGDDWNASVGANVGYVLGIGYKTFAFPTSVESVLDAIDRAEARLKEHVTVEEVPVIWKLTGVYDPGWRYRDVVIKLMAGAQPEVLKALDDARAECCEYEDELCEQFRSFEKNVRSRMLAAPARGRRRNDSMDAAFNCPRREGYRVRTMNLLSHLPEAHAEVLRRSNGLMALDGYRRLFGLGCADCVDIEWWNEHETWKFAWPADVSRFICFAETGWGDQYAYDADALERGDQRVFMLDAFEMKPELIATTFEQFIEGEFRRAPDSMTSAALERIGPLGWDDHVTYQPSLLLGGEERVENVVRIPSRASMIINGDLATQLSIADEGTLDRLVSYDDDRGRTRMRVMWR